MNLWHTMGHKRATAAPRMVWVKDRGFVVARFNGEKWVRFDLAGDHEEVNPARWSELPRTPYEI